MNPLLISGIMKIAGEIFDRVIPDKAGAEKAKLELLQQAQTQEFTAAMEQIRVNLAEAQHASIFVAGWRPFIGWVCGAGLAWHFIGHDVLAWFVAWRKVDMVLPKIQAENLMELTLAMLGMAGLRSWEKWKNVSR